MSPKETQQYCNAAVEAQLAHDDEYDREIARREQDAEMAAERGPNCDDWAHPGSDEGFECCRNQGTAFCDHGFKD